MPATSSVARSGNYYIDGLLSGYKWAGLDLTYSFPTLSSQYGSGYGSGEPTDGFAGFNNSQAAAVRTVLNSFAAVSNMSVTELTGGGGDLRFADTAQVPTAWAYGPSTSAEGGDAWFGRSSNLDAPRQGGYAYMTIVHEIGHSLGLKHAHEVENGFAAMPDSHDSMEYTVMSYYSYAGASAGSGYTNETWGYAQSLMMDDISAIQQMYGADFTTNSGGTKYSWNPGTGEMSINGKGQGAPGGNIVFRTVWDGGGVDTYDLSAYKGGVKINLEPGAWTTTSSDQLANLHWSGSEVAVGNIANARLYNGDVRSLIENAVGGAGHDAIIGNAAKNYLQGGGGNDMLKGNGGADRLSGGRGADDMYAGTGDARDNFIFYKWDSGTTSKTWDQVFGFDRQSSSSERTYDRIDLRAIDADGASGDQAFRFVSKFTEATGSQADGQVDIVDAGSHVNVLVDYDGNSTTDMIIQVMNTDTLTKADFLL